MFIKYRLNPKFQDSLSTPAQAPLSAPACHRPSSRCQPTQQQKRQRRQQDCIVGVCIIDVVTQWAKESAAPVSYNNNNDDNDDNDEYDDGGDSDDDDAAAFRPTYSFGTTHPGSHLFLLLFGRKPAQLVVFRRKPAQLPPPVEPNLANYLAVVEAAVNGVEWFLKNLLEPSACLV